MSAEETRRRARETRDRIMTLPEEALDDPPSTLLGEQGLWSLEENRPLTDEEIEASSPSRSSQR